jgi:hypothetical protein
VRSRGGTACPDARCHRDRPAGSLHRPVGGQLPVADPAVVDEDEEPDDEESDEPDEPDEPEELDEEAGFDESAVFVDESFEPVASPLEEEDADVSLVRLSVR